MGYYDYDPEIPAGFQEADFLQAQCEEESRQSARLKARGICLHNSAIGYLAEAIYPEQEGLAPNQLRCTEGCGAIFAGDGGWAEARASARFA